jgi:putative oxidoreductase
LQGELAAVTRSDVAKRVAAAVLRVGLAALLVVAGLLKLRDPAAFATEISNFQLLPALAPHLAVTLPAIEILTGLLLLGASSPWRRAAALTALALMVVFTGAVASAFTRGLDVSCGCFGSGGAPVSALTILRNLALVAAAGGLFLLEGPRSRARRAA